MQLNLCVLPNDAFLLGHVAVGDGPGWRDELPFFFTPLSQHHKISARNDPSGDFCCRLVRDVCELVDDLQPHTQYRFILIFFFVIAHLQFFWPGDGRIPLRHLVDLVEKLLQQLSRGKLHAPLSKLQREINNRFSRVAQMPNWQLAWKFSCWLLFVIQLHRHRQTSALCAIPREGWLFSTWAPALCVLSRAAPSHCPEIYRKKKKSNKVIYARGGTLSCCDKLFINFKPSLASRLLKVKSSYWLIFKQHFGALIFAWERGKQSKQIPVSKFIFHGLLASKF